MAHKKNRSALLIVDMINLLDFPEGPQLKKQALPIAHRIAVLKKKFNQLNFPVIYVNDNFGEWTSDWKTIYAKCSHHYSRGREIAALLEPGEKDFFILKPKHSGFHLTALEALLDKLNIKKLIITGMAGNICVLFTAHDAHMRGFEVLVPKDCIASNSKAQNKMALEQLSKGLKLKTPLSNRLP